MTEKLILILFRVSRDEQGCIKHGNNVLLEKGVGNAQSLSSKFSKKCKPSSQVKKFRMLGE